MLAAEARKGMEMQGGKKRGREWKERKENREGEDANGSMLLICSYICFVSERLWV